MPKHKTARIAAVFGALIKLADNYVYMKVTGTSVPRAKLGAVVATVARRFVPNCSAAIVTKIAQ